MGDVGNKEEDLRKKFTSDGDDDHDPGQRPCIGNIGLAQLQFLVPAAV
jgi:hypothetical protein